mmetsp:Transcript_75621/g.191227  ORF Transcript_75621/g.191227 Transcript_75621/m.191227 type:complete len:251 (+) Transcript_75621:603-1355(+)
MEPPSQPPIHSKIGAPACDQKRQPISQGPLCLCQASLGWLLPERATGASARGQPRPPNGRESLVVPCQLTPSWHRPHAAIGQSARAQPQQPSGWETPHTHQLAPDRPWPQVEAARPQHLHNELPQLTMRLSEHVPTWSAPMSERGPACHQTSQRPAAKSWYLARKHPNLSIVMPTAGPSSLELSGASMRRESWPLRHRSYPKLPATPCRQPIPPTIFSNGCQRAPADSDSQCVGGLLNGLFSGWHSHQWL